MSIQWVGRVLDLELEYLDAGMKAVLLGIANHTNPPNQCFPSVRLLMRYSALSERAVRSNIKKLEDAQLIKVVRRKDPLNPQLNITNLYYLTLPEGGAEYAPGGADDGAGGGAAAAPRTITTNPTRDGAANAPPPREDARAFDEDWKPSARTIERIVEEERLSVDDIERERRLFVLKCMAGTIPNNPEPAFRMWCSRVKTLNHKPAAPPPRPAGPPPIEGPAARLAHARKTRKLYERMGRTEDLPALDQEIAALEAQDDGKELGGA